MSEKITREFLEEISQKLLEKITAETETILRELIATELPKEIAKSLTATQFYRTISADLQDGLKTIYREITTATAGGAPVIGELSAEAMISETSAQLNEIMDTTEAATETIMSLVEKHLDQNERTAELLNSLPAGEHDGTLEELKTASAELGDDLMEIMTSLSFQDLTGQRIKRVVHALQQIEHLVFDLYMTAGLSMKAMEQHPEKGLEEIRETSRQRASELKGPQSDASQADVDDLLSQLGL
jgi:chemotaxis protein CheZ